MFAAIALGCVVVVWPVRDAAQPASDAGEDDEGAGLLGGLAALRADPTAGFLVGMVGVAGDRDRRARRPERRARVPDHRYRAVGRRLSERGLRRGRDRGRGGDGGARRPAPAGSAPACGGARVGRRVRRPGSPDLNRWARSSYSGSPGAASSLVDVSGRSLLQRACDPRVLGAGVRRTRGAGHGGIRARQPHGAAARRSRRAARGGDRRGAGAARWRWSVRLRRLLAIDAHATVPIVQIGLLRLSASSSRRCPRRRSRAGATASYRPTRPRAR